jgi:hypothetical protein
VHENFKYSTYTNWYNSEGSFYIYSVDFLPVALYQYSSLDTLAEFVTGYSSQTYQNITADRSHFLFDAKSTIASVKSTNRKCRNVQVLE